MATEPAEPAAVGDEVFESLFPAVTAVALQYDPQTDELTYWVMRDITGGWEQVPNWGGVEADDCETI